MENNDIKKALECCLTTSEGDCIACGYRGKKDGLFITCTNCLMADALALINKQETEYNELYELLQTYKADSEAYRSYSKTLEKENEGLKTLLDESYDTQNSLTEENERLSGAFKQYEEERQYHFEMSRTRIAEAKVDTVRKMQTLIEEKADSCDICLINSNKPIDIIYQISKKQLDQIAKEMLEGEE